MIQLDEQRRWLEREFKRSQLDASVKQTTVNRPMKFRRKTVEVEAEQYFGYLPEPKGVCFCHQQQHRMAHVHTPKGLDLIESGDWIVTTQEGQYPHKRSAFECEYEPVQEEHGSSGTGICKGCGGETSDYEGLQCIRRALDEVRAALKRAVQEDLESKRADHYTRMRYAYDVIARVEDTK